MWPQPSQAFYVGDRWYHFRPLNTFHEVCDCELARHGYIHIRGTCAYRSIDVVYLGSPRLSYILRRRWSSLVG